MKMDVAPSGYVYPPTPEEWAKAIAYEQQVINKDPNRIRAPEDKLLELLNLHIVDRKSQ